MLDITFDSSLSVNFRTTVAESKASSSSCNVSTSSNPMPSFSLRLSTKSEKLFNVKTSYVYIFESKILNSTCIK